MSKITLEFTYNLPDERFAATNNLNKTATWTYHGPEKFYIYLSSTTNKITDNPALPYEKIRDNCPVKQGMYSFLVNAKQYPLVATLFYPSESHNTVGLENILLPDGRTFQEDFPLRPTDCYYKNDIEFDRTTNSFIEPYPFATNDVTWDDIRNMRDMYLTISDKRINEDAPDSVNQPWIEYRQALRDLPTVWADRPAYSIIFPDAPND